VGSSCAMCLGIRVLGSGMKYSDMRGMPQMDKSLAGCTLERINGFHMWSQF
jgi:hypothetical protein